MAKTFTMEMETEIAVAISADRKLALVDGKPTATDPNTLSNAVLKALGIEKAKRTGGGRKKKVVEDTAEGAEAKTASRFRK